MIYFRPVVCLIILVLCPVVVWGDDFRIVPSISVKEEYNSNVLFSTNNVKSDFITHLSPGVEMMDRTERLSADLLLGLDRLEYAANRDLSATNQTYNGKFRYLVTPLLGISAEAGYARNANPTLTVQPTGIIETATPWQHVTSSLSADYQLSELTGVAVSYAYGRDHFQNRKDLDDISHDISAGLVYDLGRYFPLLKGRINVGYNYYSFQNSRIDNVVSTVGLSRELTETWSVAVDGGLRHTDSETSVTQYELLYYLLNINDGQISPVYRTSTTSVQLTGWGWVGDATLSYKGELGNCDLSYTRDLTPATGLNGAAGRNSVTFSARYRPTYELSFSFASGYYSLKSKPSEFSVQGIDQTTMRVSPGARYEFSKDIFAEISYEYQSLDDSVSRAKTHRHLFFGRLYIQQPFLE